MGVNEKAQAEVRRLVWKLDWLQQLVSGKDHVVAAGVARVLASDLEATARLLADDLRAMAKTLEETGNG